MDGSELNDDFLLLGDVLELLVDGGLIVADMSDDEFLVSLDDDGDHAPAEDAVLLLEALLLVEVCFDLVLESVECFLEGFLGVGVEVGVSDEAAEQQSVRDVGDQMPVLSVAVQQRDDLRVLSNSHKMGYLVVINKKIIHVRPVSLVTFLGGDGYSDVLQEVLRRVVLPLHLFLFFFLFVRHAALLLLLLLEDIVELLLLRVKFYLLLLPHDRLVVPDSAPHVQSFQQRLRLLHYLLYTTYASYVSTLE